jgi:hypothetical protein
LAEDQTRGLENNAALVRSVYLSAIRPMPTPLLLKEYDAFIAGLMAQAPEGFLEAFAKLVREQKDKTAEA